MWKDSESKDETFIVIEPMNGVSRPDFSLLIMYFSKHGDTQNLNKRTTVLFIMLTHEIEDLCVVLFSHLYSCNFCFCFCFVDGKITSVSQLLCFVCVFYELSENVSVDKFFRVTH